MPDANASLVGMGLYQLREAARLIRVPAGTFARWVRGYYFPGRSQRRFSAGLVRRELEGEGLKDVLTFIELIELHFVAMFRREGVSMQCIRAAATKAAELFGVDHPFAVSRFRTDGKRIYALLRQDPPRNVPPKVLALDLARSQHVFTELVEPFFRKLSIDEERVVEYWPLEKDRCVVLDPRRAFGMPIDAASGVETSVLYRAWAAGEPIARLAEWFDVTPDAVRCGVDYERWLASRTTETYEEWLAKAA